MKCPYCLKDIVLLEEDICPECKTQIDKVIVDNIKNADFVSVAFVGESEVGKTSYLTSLFSLFMYDDKYIKSHKLLNEEAFESILNNIKLLKNNIVPEGTNQMFLEVPLIRLTLKNNSNCVVSFIDIRGEIYNDKEELKINPQAQKVFISDIIFWIIDGERFFSDLLNNESDVLDDLALINRYLNVKHEFNENKQKVVIIFTKIDKVYNLLYEHKELFECFNKNKNNDLYQNVENIENCSNNIKKFLNEKGLSNFINSVEDEFKSVLFSLTSSFPKGDNKEFKYDKNTPINVIEPFIYDFYKIEIEKENQRKREQEVKKQQELNKKKQIKISIMIIIFIIFLFIINSLFHPYEKYQQYQCQNGDIQICKKLQNYKKACEIGDKQSCLQIENYKKGCELGDSKSCNIIKCENNDKYACRKIGNYQKGCELGDNKSCNIIKCENNNKYACKKIGNNQKLCELGDKQSCIKIGNKQKACNLGDFKSCLKIGNNQKLCELGDKQSCVEIGDYRKACELGDKASCIEILDNQKACELGDKQSCVEIGDYRKACELGDVDNCLEIGNHKKACELGDKRSCNIIKCKNNDKAACKKIGNYQKLCDLGDKKICLKIGNYKKACNLGDVDSCLIVGDRYKNKNDLHLALKFYKKACHFGIVDDCKKYVKLKNQLQSSGR